VSQTHDSAMSGVRLLHMAMRSSKLSTLPRHFFTGDLHVI